MWGENVQLSRTGAEHTGQEDRRVRSRGALATGYCLCLGTGVSVLRMGVFECLFEQIIQTFSHLPFRTFMLQDLQEANWVDHSEAIAGMQEN